MKPLIWIAVLLMLLGAALLVADIGATGLWIAVIAAGIGLVAVAQWRGRPHSAH